MAVKWHLFMINAEVEAPKWSNDWFFKCLQCDEIKSKSSIFDFSAALIYCYCLFTLHFFNKFKWTYPLVRRKRDILYLNLIFWRKKVLMIFLRSNTKKYSIETYRIISPIKYVVLRIVLIKSSINHNLCYDLIKNRFNLSTMNNIEMLKCFFFFKFCHWTSIVDISDEWSIHCIQDVQTSFQWLLSSYNCDVNEVKKRFRPIFYETLMSWPEKSYRFKYFWWWFFHVFAECAHFKFFKQFSCK